MDVAVRRVDDADPSGPSRQLRLNLEELPGPCAHRFTFSHHARRPDRRGADRSRRRGLNVGQRQEPHDRLGQFLAGVLLEEVSRSWITGWSTPCAPRISLRKIGPIAPVMGSPSLNATSIGVGLSRNVCPRRAVGRASPDRRATSAPDPASRVGPRSRSRRGTGRRSPRARRRHGPAATATGRTCRLDLGHALDGLCGTATRSPAWAGHRWAGRCWRRRCARTGPGARRPGAARSGRPSPARPASRAAGRGRRTRARASTRRVAHRCGPRCAAGLSDRPKPTRSGQMHAVTRRRPGSGSSVRYR